MPSPIEQRVLVTGSGGFIGKNLVVRLGELGGRHVLHFGRKDSPAGLATLVRQADVVIHLAGENRPADESGFRIGNAELTEALCHAIELCGRPVPVAFSSSSQAELGNPYGRSKRSAEESLQRLSARTGCPVSIFRLPNVFGKWSQPKYNSVVATFCYNVARNLPIRIHKADSPLDLVYVDDVVAELICFLSAPGRGMQWREVRPVYSTTVGDLAALIGTLRESRANLRTERVGTGLARALYATYVSHLPSSDFSYDLPLHADARGVFVEMLKTPDCGQFSFFTSRPGVIRGRHYHHTKTEKFLVVKGTARFAFRNLISGERYELQVSAATPRIVESIPGWSHDVTNVGDDELVVMLWANEIFDRERPDTVAAEV